MMVRHSFNRTRLLSLSAYMFGAWIGFSMPAGLADTGSKAGDPSTDVKQLIDRLGSDSYATRVRAREKLERMGLEAFDELHSAQYHADSEIAAAARQLVSSLLVSWSKETDPPEVRDALNEYGAQIENERSNRLERLAALPDRKGLAAMVRLARFETSLRLSRDAALAVMRQPMSEDVAVRRHHAQVIRSTLQGNDRQASQWLLAYAGDLSGDGYSADRWHQLIQQQRSEIDSASSQQSTRSSVLELVRVCATRAADAGQREEALRLAGENLDLITPTTRDLTDACSWAIDNRLHPIVLRLSEKHRRPFSNQPILLYGAAEAELDAGNEQAADELAARAVQIKPIPVSADEQKKLSPNRLEEIAQTHREIGQELQSRGLFRWAEREYRQIIAAMEIDSIPSAMARDHLARMLGELERHQDVVDVLEPLVDRIAKDEQLKRRLYSINFSDRTARSDVDFHRAMAMIDQGDIDGAKPLLTRALDANRENVDILIAMYRLDAGPQWNASVRDNLRLQSLEIANDIRNMQARSQQMGRMFMTDSAIAHRMNQYAWLVGNTEGDYQQALQYSLRSLELTPNESALLDTCARCYFAVGDIDNAILYQRRALKLMPHSPPMIRQLNEFEAVKANTN